jgi:thiamine transporter ThiT
MDNSDRNKILALLFVGVFMRVFYHFVQGLFFHKKISGMEIKL